MILGATLDMINQTQTVPSGQSRKVHPPVSLLKIQYPHVFSVSAGQLITSMFLFSIEDRKLVINVFTMGVYEAMQKY